MLIGVTRETKPGETRVAATPATVKQLTGLGYEVVIEAGAGAGSCLTEKAYVQAGAVIGTMEEAWSADVVFRVNAPELPDVERLKEGAKLVAPLAPAARGDLLMALAARKIDAFAMDAVPRISRAQPLDILSSQANIAGYRAVIEAAHHFGRFLAGQVTAAGKVPPAKVLVAGAGVAGLAAIAAASSLGAIVRATDPRPEVADQVKSLGGEYLPVDVDVEQSTDGYAKATSEAYDKRATEIYSEQAAEVDIIVTTALIPGRPAPRLITAADVASMKPGSLIVDMAAAQGGNVEGSVKDEVITTDNGVTIIGYTDLPARLPAQSSQLYGANLVNLMKLLTPAKDGQVTLDLEDAVQRGLTVVHQGDVLWPPPPVQVSASPAVAAPVQTPQKKAERKLSPTAKLALTGTGSLALFVLNASAPSEITQHFTVLMLAVVVGFYVIGHVHHALHTPLMSVTNAISGIVVVGALLQLTVTDNVVQVLAGVATLLTSINIFGGFSVTRRMLAMFRKA
ncbi:Re/Si-specific NAD(P)(+) transhydrogenase subunit alpha [Streptomyces chartreusis]|uniref:Re/Si-specific NAD(P)(+) transhydrogenase subunit alpha n=1 Tax=Streptomyces chartreusis TaxID=1969 RepID=UPI002F918AF3|nr:Re/Si-specific NAD(P)(+) transhydrogenase subunit alpha [Streptomyces chartreusis]WTA33538.1 Re/Si-specific NAD(P)(+) transhydrogenase subunit alpha [Streptomyces chartreusis]